MTTDRETLAIGSAIIRLELTRNDYPPDLVAKLDRLAGEMQAAACAGADVALTIRETVN